MIRVGSGGLVDVLTEIENVGKGEGEGRKRGGEGKGGMRWEIREGGGLASWL